MNVDDRDSTRKMIYSRRMSRSETSQKMAMLSPNILRKVLSQSNMRQPRLWRKIRELQILHFDDVNLVSLVMF